MSAAGDPPSPPLNLSPDSSARISRTVPPLLSSPLPLFPKPARPKSDGIPFFFLDKIGERFLSPPPPLYLRDKLWVAKVGPPPPKA